MAFIPMVDLDSLTPEQQEAHDRQLASHGGRITNMKAALLAHVPTFDMYMAWYDLRKLLIPVIGERAFALFCYSISDANDCLICSVFFRRILIDSGENPDDPQTTDDENLLMEFGRAISKNPHDIPEEIYARIEERYSEVERVQLVAFAAQMVAANVFNTVSRLPLDEVLYEYRKPEPAPAS